MLSVKLHQFRFDSQFTIFGNNVGINFQVTPQQNKKSGVKNSRKLATRKRNYLIIKIVQQIMRYIVGCVSCNTILSQLPFIQATDHCAIKGCGGTPCFVHPTLQFFSIQRYRCHEPLTVNKQWQCFVDTTISK